MKELCDVFHEFSVRAQKWVLAGVMTLNEAQYLTEYDLDSDLPDLNDVQVSRCMERRHGKHHRKMVKKCPAIERVLESENELEEELCVMNDRLVQAFVEGHLTLRQVRYASLRQLRGVVLQNFLQLKSPELRSPVKKEFLDLHEEANRARLAAIADAQMERSRLDFLEQLEIEGDIPAHVIASFREAGTALSSLEAYASANCR